jgi:PAS domain S-box-containing protein
MAGEVNRGSGAESQLHAETMEALHEIAVAAGGVTDQIWLAELVVERARLIAGGDAAVLRWFEPTTSTLRLLAVTGARPDPAGEIALDAQTAISDAFKTRQPVIVNDYQASDQTTAWGRDTGIAAQVAVPLLVEGRPVGTLVVLSYGLHAYEAYDALFLSLMAAIVAPALEAARLTKEVRRQNERRAQIYEALPVMVVVYGRDGTALQHNTAAEAALGSAGLEAVLERAIVLYREDGTVIPDEERPFAQAMRMKAPVRGVVAGFGGPVRRWAYIDAVPLFDEQGEVESVITSSIDITELKAAQAEQRQSEQLFTGAFRASGIGMALTDLDGSVMRANPALCEMLGYGECDLAGMDARRLIVAEDLARVVEELTGVYVDTAAEVATTDLRVAHKDGHAIWVRLTASLIRVDGEPKHVLLHLVDVTEERKAEAILKAEQDRLGEIIDAQREIAGTEVDLEQLLGVLVERTVRLTGAGAAAVLLPGGDNLVVRAIAGTPDLILGYELPIDHSLAGMAFVTGRLQQASDAKTDARAHTATAIRGRLGAMVACPLVSGGRTIGVLQLLSDAPGALDEVDARTIQMIAGFAAAAFERASTTRRLTASEQRIRAVVEAAPYPIVMFDAAGMIVDFNPAAEKAFLLGRAEAVGRAASILLAPRFEEALTRWLRDGKAAGSAEYAGTRFETIGRRADGTEFPIEIAIANLPEESQLSAAFLRDLTMRERLKESSKRLAAVVSSAPVILLACGADGVVTVAEGRGLALLDLTPEGTVGRDVRDLVDRQPDALEFVERALRGETLSGQLHLVRPDLYLEGAASPITDADGEVVGVSAVLTDVTDRARAAEAQRESEAKSRLMAMMNHEVRTPLNSILGFAHLLNDPRVGELNEKQNRYVGNIQLSGHHLLSLVNDSLDLARLDAGHMTVKLEPVAVQPVLDQAADQVRPLAEARGLTLRVEAAGSVSAFADMRQLIQVLLNLLSNAIRHTRAGGTVTMAARAEGPVVSISVADTGEGIAREDLPRLFEEFFQAANHAPGGVGLGLAISRRLVEVMGGSISVESELGIGSAFTVRLPARDAGS